MLMKTIVIYLGELSTDRVGLDLLSMSIKLTWTVSVTFFIYLNFFKLLQTMLAVYGSHSEYNSRDFLQR